MSRIAIDILTLVQDFFSRFYISGGNVALSAINLKQLATLIATTLPIARKNGKKV